MTKEYLITKVKEYCEYELDYTRRHGNVNLALTRCYGAVMFVGNLDGFDEELGKWWDDVMLPRFRNYL